MSYFNFMIIRDELPRDIDAIRSVVMSAFAQAPHSSGTEAAIVEALRANGVLTISLVAEEQGEVVGHIAFSPVSIGGIADGWFGLGPVAVVPHAQRRGIGKGLIKTGLERLKAMGAQGSVVLGEPNYYSRFGFERDPKVRFPAAPMEYFQRLCFHNRVPSGIVEYQTAFY